MSLPVMTKRRSSRTAAALLALSTLLLSRSAFAGGEAGFEAFNVGDYETALTVWQPLAEAGDADSQFGLGQLYGNGFGVAMDDALAIKWYSAASEQGHAEASYRLGVMYQNGWGVPQSDAEMMRYFELAANGGFTEAHRSLGDLYMNGFGVDANPVLALQWFTTAASLGDIGSEISAEEIAGTMSPEQVAEGKKLADAWIAEHGQD